MVKHIVMWNLKDTLSEKERQEAKEYMKTKLEALKDAVEGAVAIEVLYDGLETSNRDIALISTFESEDALKEYQTHPGHVEAVQFIRKVTCDRVCFDF